MPYDISKHGDIYERKYFTDIIQSRLPAYQNIWQNYIGNSGTNNLPALNKDKSDFKLIRKKFSELHYSIFFSVVCCFKIKEDYKQNKKETLIDMDIDASITLIAFIAYIGRIRDLYNELSAYVQFSGSKDKELQDFYVKRSNVIHGRKLPYTIQNGEYVIPDIEGIKEDEYLWNDENEWENFENLYPITLSEFMDRTYDELLIILDGCLSALYSWLRNNYSVSISEFNNDIISYPKVNVIQSGIHGRSGFSEPNKRINSENQENGNLFGSSGSSGYRPPN